MHCLLFLWWFALVTIKSDRSIRSCTIIGMDYQDLLLNEYLSEVQAKNKNKTTEEKETERSVEATKLMNELVELREKMMNTTLKTKFFFTTLDKTAEHVPNKIKYNIQYEVERNYNELKNLKVALWRQKTSSTKQDMETMKHLGVRVDVAFFLLLMQCLLPPIYR